MWCVRVSFRVPGFVVGDDYCSGQAVGGVDKEKAR